LQGGSAGSSESRAVAVGVLEHAALLAVKARDLAAFEREVAQLQQLYASEESALKYEVLGLNLLRLLAVDRMADFHTQLELVPAAKRADPHIAYPVAMEQHMMEGTYHKVLAASRTAPSPWCAFFVQLLSETVRAQIAECLSRAYASLSRKEAAELLLLNSPDELTQFEKQFDWHAGPDGRIVFAKTTGEVRVPKHQVMEQTLILAEELERIV
jgi:26S proteasome regulatory subunit N12